jgi:hypothetical protein
VEHRRLAGAARAVDPYDQAHVVPLVGARVDGGGDAGVHCGVELGLWWDEVR